MRVVNLVENIAGRPGCTPAHGLSFYIETPRHRLLMDAGPGDMLTDNARALGVDLSRVDAVVLSHGHYDHGDGLAALSRVNPAAKVYLRKTAARRYFGVDEDGSMHYIGVAPEALRRDGLIWVDGTLEIDEELTLFGDISGRRHWPEANLRLRREAGDGVAQDDFDHEQCLVVTADGLRVLFSGCAHNGILNILDRYRALFGGWPDAVVSGFHMMKKAAYTPDEEQTILDTAEALKQVPCRYFTGHCTGLPAFELMKGVLGERLRYVRCGEEVRL